MRDNIKQLKKSIVEIRAKLDSIEKSLESEIEKEECNAFIANHIKCVKDCTGKEVKAIPQDTFLKLYKQGIHTMIPVGTLIQLNNQFCDLYEVIGINHDNTENTIDIMSHYQVIAMQFGEENNEYEYSYIRKWLNKRFLSNFDNDVSTNLKYMEVVSNNTILNDKVKILSVKELGFENDTYFDKHEYNNNFYSNDKYEAFENCDRFKESKSKWRNTNNGLGDGWGIWTRSRRTGSTTVVWRVTSDGTCGTNFLTDSHGVLPVLRF